MKRVYLFLADGFEEIEALTVVDLLRRTKEIEVITVSIMNRLMVNGSHGIKVEADCCYEELTKQDVIGQFMDGDMLVLPGGGQGTEHLYEYKPLTELIRIFGKDGKYLAAICAAPSIFGRLGMLPGKHATCYPGFEDKMTGAIIEDAAVVHDGHLITARGMGVSVDFALKLIELLDSKKTADSVASKIQDERYR